MSDLLQTSVWQALTTAQSHLAITRGKACRYPAEVAPFAALKAPTPEAMHDLLALLAPGESLYLLGPPPRAIPGLLWDGVVPCLQMLFPATAPVPAPPNASLVVEPLNCSHAAEMLTLINLAFPGFFRSETCRMGPYWGIRDGGGTLIAMGGERLVYDLSDEAAGSRAWREISGLCSHPAYAARGAGTSILCHILAEHRTQGSRSWLQVKADNLRAVALYQRLGFQIADRVELHRLRRLAP